MAASEPERAKELKVLSRKKMGKAREIMLDELMSSEEEDRAADSDNRGRPQRVVKRLKWESKKAHKIKVKLDDFYINHVASARQQACNATIVTSERYSDKVRNLDKIPEWAIKSAWQQPG